jgi:hypothetical protein
MLHYDQGELHALVSTVGKVAMDFVNPDLHRCFDPVYDLTSPFLE